MNTVTPRRPTEPKRYSPIEWGFGLGLGFTLGAAVPSFVLFLILIVMGAIASPFYVK